MEITVTTKRLYRNFSTIKHYENEADYKIHSSLASSKACEWAPAKKCENAEDGKVTKAERVDYSVIPVVVN